MKIKTREMAYESVLQQKGFAHKKPQKTKPFFRWLLKTLSEPELRKVNFTLKQVGMEKLGKEEPCLFLMNHSSFIDLKIASSILYPRPFHIVCTYDGFVGKRGLMEAIGCIPTHKFTMDLTLVRDMIYTVKQLKSSILMYPEASYSFDGTETPLPESLGKCLKLLKVPVVMISTRGAFARDPLYNNLQLRKVDVSATMEYLLSPEDIGAKSVAELNAILQKAFSYDHFRWQKENQVAITEPFRADSLNRVLYKCPVCGTEGELQGKGGMLTCTHCGAAYRLTELGEMEAVSGQTPFRSIPQWYRWQRENVRKELEEGSYRMELPVDVYMMVNTDCVYQVGTGTLTHTDKGFHLVGCDGKLDYSQEAAASYSLYSDFYWYEIGDVICIGDAKTQYYCFPQTKDDVVAKARLAAEELYKLLPAKKPVRV